MNERVKDSDDEICLMFTHFQTFIPGVFRFVNCETYCFNLSTEIKAIV